MGPSKLRSSPVRRYCPQAASRRSHCAHSVRPPCHRWHRWADQFGLLELVVVPGLGLQHLLRLAVGVEDARDVHHEEVEVGEDWRQEGVKEARELPELTEN
jgi:hypothetical protein